MAFTPLVPVSLSAQAIQGKAQNFTATTAVKNPGGTAINLSTFFSMTAKLVATNPNPNTADQTFGTATGDSSGIITLTMAATDLASVPLGTATLIITGKPLTGDSDQVLATGSFTLSAG